MPTCVMNDTLRLGKIQGGVEAARMRQLLNERELDLARLVVTLVHDLEEPALSACALSQRLDVAVETCNENDAYDILRMLGILASSMRELIESSSGHPYLDLTECVLRDRLREVARVV